MGKTSPATGNPFKFKWDGSEGLLDGLLPLHWATQSYAASPYHILQLLDTWRDTQAWGSRSICCWKMVKAVARRWSHTGTEKDQEGIWHTASCLHARLWWEIDGQVILITDGANFSGCFLCVGVGSKRRWWSYSHENKFAFFMSAINRFKNLGATILPKNDWFMVWINAVSCLGRKGNLLSNAN